MLFLEMLLGVEQFDIWLDNVESHEQFVKKLKTWEFVLYKDFAREETHVKLTWKGIRLAMVAIIVSHMTASSTIESCEAKTDFGVHLYSADDNIQCLLGQL